jgi:tRNA (mo5U34)-methyltransferase
VIDYRPLIERWRDGELDAWARLLPQQVDAGLSHQRYGDLPRWLEALASLPDIEPAGVRLDAPRVGATARTTLDHGLQTRLREALMALHPWRKGPYELFGLHIDSEWRSDWKWDRLGDHVDDLRGRRILDVGCGNGYHCWRMLGGGAAEVIGIDPSPLSTVQFWALQKYLRQDGIHLLPVGIEQVPPRLRAFDTVFSMGVLYHRRSPMDHLQELLGCLRPGGQLVLETLVIEGGRQDVLVPPGRYARMGNVWFLPSCEALLEWVRKIGFRDPRVVDVTVTTTGEQRATEWMRFHSLADFLDPRDSGRSIEGHPAPRRAILVARADG